MNVHPVLICEHCTYANLSRRFYDSWDELVEHVRVQHWTRVGTRSGQALYACSNHQCGQATQMSYDPVVDFAGNVYCSRSCATGAYRARLAASDMITVLSQEQRDEEYVRESLGIPVVNPNKIG